MQSILCTKLGLGCPIFQAPTGSIAGPELAAAVSTAGGLGAMALTWASPEVASAQVSAVRAASRNPFQVNFALAFAPLSLTAALEAGAPVITFSWGDPAPYVPLVRSFGARLGIQVTSGMGATAALAHMPDFLICQGIEAGGHVQATRNLEIVLSEVLAAAEGVPVVASGGIGDGRAVGAALRAGASGAMLGTRFVAARESRAHDRYKELLIEADSGDASLTVCFDGGWPYAAHRVLRNSTLEGWEAAGCPPPGRRPGEGEPLGANALGEPILRYEDTAPRAGFTGDIAGMCCYAGTSCGEIRDLPPAAELVARLWADARDFLAAS